MLTSMTGYGSATYEGEEGSLRVVASSVNHRFLELQLRLPEGWQALEPRIRRKVQALCQRGRITVSVEYERPAQAAVVGINREKIAAYIAWLRQIKEDFSLAGEVDLHVLAAFPDVLHPASAAATPLTETLAERVEATVQCALRAMIEMRQAEGRELEHDMHKRLDILERCLNEIEADARSLTEHYRQKLLDRLDALKGTLSLDPTRLAQEVVFLASRADISEEIVRVRSHLQHYRSLLRAEEAVGKKLDFLLQEMNREVNTILSKAGELTICSAALQMKAEIEKLREQAQNVE
ncbi:MAG TPA: YicC/YloC family endoribonuclease [Blastocatellia bacterium]|nr:YicC/YloC family endoribonuclease [Blastocatellia bacterium]